jgi:hypothetical protein
MSELKTKFKYIYFEQVSDTGKTSRWACYNNSSNDLLGGVYWYSRWRQYCFFPQYETVFSAGCLEDMNTFMKALREHELEARGK